MQHIECQHVNSKPKTTSAGKSLHSCKQQPLVVSGLAIVLSLIAGILSAKEIGTTVREREFRKVWNVEVEADRLVHEVPRAPRREITEEGGEFYVFGERIGEALEPRLEEIFRELPVSQSEATLDAIDARIISPSQLRQEEIDNVKGDSPFTWSLFLETGWEYEDVASGGGDQFNGVSDSSLFVGFGSTLRYRREVRQLTLEAIYSGGYRYYLDHDYVNASSGLGGLAQTFGLALEMEGSHLSLLSQTRASYGFGDDLEAGSGTRRIDFGQQIELIFEPDDYNQIELDVSTSFSLVSDGNNQSPDDEQGLPTLDAGLFWEKSISDKTSVGPGIQFGFDRQNGFERRYAQGLIEANFRPGEKLALGVGLGATFQSYEGDPAADPFSLDGSEEQVQLAYSLQADYSPTEKTAISLLISQQDNLRFPEVRVTGSVNPRPTQSFSLSAYRLSDVSVTQPGLDLRTTGVVLGLSQTLFGRTTLSLTGGYETIEYTTANTGNEVDLGIEKDGYGFAAIGLTWQMSRRLQLDASLRASTERPGPGSGQPGDSESSLIFTGLTRLTLNF